MNERQTIQYTVRGVSERTDLVLREKAVREKKSLNEAALAALEYGLGLAGESAVHTDLDDLAGTWVKSPDFDRLLKKMDSVDKDLWK